MFRVKCVSRAAVFELVYFKLDLMTILVIEALTEDLVKIRQFDPGVLSQFQN